MLQIYYKKIVKNKTNRLKKSQFIVENHSYLLGKKKNYWEIFHIISLIIPVERCIMNVIDKFLSQLCSQFIVENHSYLLGKKKNYWEIFHIISLIIPVERCIMNVIDKFLSQLCPFLGKRGLWQIRKEYLCI